MQGASKETARRHAGSGAAAQASAAAERAQRYRDKALVAERQEQAWRAGSEGERLVADTLARAGWPVLHDQPWPGRQRANLDHLAFSPTRLWLIDAKHWSGDVTVRDGVLRQNGYSRGMAQEKAKVAAADVANRLGGTAPPIAPVLCLTQAASDLAPTTVDGVLVVGLQRLPEALGPAPLLDFELARLMESTPALLRGETVATVAPVGRPDPHHPRSAPAAYLHQRRGAATRRRPSTRAAPAGARRSRRKKDAPGVGRAFVGLLLLGALYAFATHLATVTQLLQPVGQWWVEQAFPG